MTGLLKAADAIHRGLEWVASAAGWLLVVLMALTCFDVVCRKFGLPLPYTKLQEMEWHLHTAIFALWLGYNYTINAHPRVDSYVAGLSFRRKAWIELIGILIFALPYTLTVLYFGWEFVRYSYGVNEHSEAAAGLSHRWVIKGVLFAGLVLLLLGIVSVLLRLIAYLFGGRHAAEIGLRLGPSATEV